MKRKFVSLLMVSLIATSMLAGCGTTSDTQKTETKETQSEETETTTKKGRPYGDISYVTKSPTCTEDGVRTFYGKDGEYTKPEPATGHKFDDVMDIDGNVVGRRCEYCGESDPDWSPEESTQNQ